MNFKKEYSYTRPILFQGKTFPSAEQTLMGSDGNLYSKTVFADKDGNSYFIDSKNALVPVTPYGGELPNVLITAPKRNTGIVDMANDYPTMSNDNTKVTNQPHREYNPHLKSQTLQGAKSNAIWEKEHPNASSWMYALNAAPFAIAAAPAAIPVGQTLANTALGQTAINGISKVMDNPIVETANNILGIGFGVHGAYNASQGNVTPTTLLEIAGAYPGIKAAEGIVSSFVPKSSNALSDKVFNIGNVEDNTFKFTGYVEDPLLMHFKRAKAKGYNTSNINILDLSKDTPEAKAFFKRTAQKFNMTTDEAKGELLSHMDKHGHAAVPNWESIIIHDGKGGDRTNAILSHELDHVLHIPDEPLPEGTLFPRIKNLYGDEFTKQNNSEIAARGSQLHDYFGHISNEPITEDMLKYARDNYVKDTGLNNDMNDILWSVNNYKGLADWMTKYSTGIIPFGMVGATYNNRK